MYRRGELTKVHMLSESQKEWFPAAEIIASWDLPKAIEPEETAEGPLPQALWYYLTPKNVRIGPVSSEELKMRANRGEVASNTLVFGSGMTGWSPAWQLSFLGLPEGKTVQKFPLWGILLLGLVICMLTATVGYFVVRIFIPSRIESNGLTAPEVDQPFEDDFEAPAKPEPAKPEPAKPEPAKPAKEEEPSPSREESATPNADGNSARFSKPTFVDPPLTIMPTYALLEDSRRFHNPSAWLRDTTDDDGGWEPM